MKLLKIAYKPMSIKLTRKQKSLGMVAFVFIVGIAYFFITKLDKFVTINTAPQTEISSDGGCFKSKDLPKNNEYISYKLADCGIAITFLKKSQPIVEKIKENYDTLYNSRSSFDKEIKKLHDKSKDLSFIWDPEKDYSPYKSENKNRWDENKGPFLEKYSYINVGKYLITIISPADAFDMDNSELYTKVSITENGKELFKKEYQEVSFHFIYKIKVASTEYYLFGLCGGGMHGCQLLVPVVYNGGIPVIGNEISGDFSNFLHKEDFFTKNGELYTIIDDSRYFFQYSTSNNASYNSAVPLVVKFDKKTGNRINAMSDFVDLYKKSTDIIANDFNKLKEVLSIVKDKDTRIKLMNFTSQGNSLVPYFDYYLGMSIISNDTNYNAIREKIGNMYTNFYGEKNPELHLFGYQDFEKPTTAVISYDSYLNKPFEFDNFPSTFKTYDAVSPKFEGDFVLKDDPNYWNDWASIFSGLENSSLDFAGHYKLVIAGNGTMRDLYMVDGLTGKIYSLSGMMATGPSAYLFKNNSRLLVIVMDNSGGFVSKTSEDKVYFYYSLQNDKSFKMLGAYVYKNNKFVKVNL